MPVQFSYSYKLELSYISSSNNKEYIIAAPSVSYLYIMRDYETDVRPYILFKVKLDSDIYSRMHDDQGKGKINLNIMVYNKNGTSSVYKSYINDQFDFMMQENPNPTSEFDKAVAGQGIAYKTCTVGLHKSDLIKQNQRQFNGIYKNTNMSSLVLDATSHMRMLIEPLKFNTPIENLQVPAVDTVAKYLAFLNNKYNFYGEQYTYFCDFDKTYLKSNSGKYIDAKDGQYPYVAIDIRKMSDYKSHTTGIVVDDSQKAYIIYIDPSYVTIDPDRITPQTSATIVSIDDNGNKQSSMIDTSIITNTSSDENSKLFVSSNDPNVSEYIANSVTNRSVPIIISKTEMDATLFTPNKEYLISNYEGNNNYTGRYYLASKQEYFVNKETEFMCTINLGLRMVVHYK